MLSLELLYGYLPFVLQRVDWLMKPSLLFDCPRELIENWWLALESDEWCVELTPCGITNPESDGVLYRSGSVRRDHAKVYVRPCPGPPSWSDSPLAGRHLLLLEYGALRPRDRAANQQLSKQMADALTSHGAAEIRPRGH